MRIIDLHILRRMLSTFVFVVLILVVVITVIDLAEKMDKYAQAHLGILAIAGYYLDFIPWIAGLITPITTFIATVYVTARMAAHTEIIAILCSGVSFRRMLVPYLTGACLIAGGSFALNGWLIPNSNRSRLDFEVQYLRSQYYYDKQNIHIQVGPDTYLYMRSYDNHSNRGYMFTLEKLSGNRMIKKLTARSIEWDSTKNTWRLTDWKLKEVSEIFSDSNMIATHAPVDGSEFVEKGTAMDTALLISPKEFQNDYRKFDGMTIDELNSYIKSLRARGSPGVEAYEVEKYTRYAHPFTILILTFMGVIVSSQKSRGGTGYQIAMGFLLSFIFILFFMMFRTFAEAGTMHPAISVWIPSAIFGVISLVMYKYIPR